MSDSNIPMTKETENNLKQNIDLAIEYIAKSMDEVRSLLRKVDFFCDSIEKKNIITNAKTSFDEIINMLEYRMLIGIIYLDLASSSKAHLCSQSKYEKLFSLRQIIVIINEGYKQIYHFVSQDKNGNLMTKHRNGSFWCKDIRKIIEESQPELLNDYNQLTIKLDNYADENLSSVKNIRDLFVHYDKNASKVYDVTLSLNVDETFRKMSPFLGILNEMFRFTGKMAIISKDIQRKKKEDAFNQIESTFIDLEDKVASHLTEKNSNQINELLDTMRKTRIEFMKKIKSPNT